MGKRSPFTYACWKGNTFKGSFSQNNDYMQILSFMGFSQPTDAIAQSSIPLSKICIYFCDGYGYFH